MAPARQGDRRRRHLGVERWLLSADGGHGWATAWRPYHAAARDYTVSGDMRHWIMNIPGGPTPAGAVAASPAT